MSKRRTSNPTAGELEILRVLWEIGPATVRQVNSALNKSRPTGYTTTLKLMQIMLDKGLLARDESVRPQVWRPAVSRQHAQRQLVGGLLDRLFAGSAGKLVLHLLAEKRLTPKELAEIRRTIARHAGRKGA